MPINSVIESIGNNIYQVIGTCSYFTTVSGAFSAFIFSKDVKQEAIANISFRMEDYSILLEEDYIQYLPDGNIIALDNLRHTQWWENIDICRYLQELFKCGTIAYLPMDENDSLKKYLKSMLDFADFCQTGIITKFP